MDALITAVLVAAAALWAAARLFRRTRPSAGGCSSACSGCPAASACRTLPVATPQAPGRALPLPPGDGGSR